MESDKDCERSELNSKLGECNIHHHSFEYICTSSFCSLSRLKCDECIINPPHSNCVNDSIPIKDLFLKNAWESKDSLKNWVRNPELRNNLNELHKNVEIKNPDVIYQKKHSTFEDFLSKIEEESLKKFEFLLKEFKSKAKSLLQSDFLLKQYQSHFNYENLLTILKNKTGKSLEKELKNFFSLKPEHLFSIKGSQMESIQTELTKEFELKLDSTLNLLEKDLDKLISNSFIPKIKEINRFKNIVGELNYGNQRIDCISFQSYQNFDLHGIGIYKSRIPNQNWNILVMLLEGDVFSNDKPFLKKELFRVKNNIENLENLVEKLIFEVPIPILSNIRYTVSVLINGNNTPKGVEGIDNGNFDGLFIRFFDTKYNEKDRTCVLSGQIPILYYIKQ